MQSKKSVPVNWTLWEGQLNCHNTCIPQATKTWEQRLNDMSFRDFEQLEQFIVRNPLPEMERLTINDAMCHICYFESKDIPTQMTKQSFTIIYFITFKKTIHFKLICKNVHS